MQNSIMARGKRTVGTCEGRTIDFPNAVRLNTEQGYSPELAVPGFTPINQPANRTLVETVESIRAPRKRTQSLDDRPAKMRRQSHHASSTQLVEGSGVPESSTPLTNSRLPVSPKKINQHLHLGKLPTGSHDMIDVEPNHLHAARSLLDDERTFIAEDGLDDGLFAKFLREDLSDLIQQETPSISHCSSASIQPPKISENLTSYEQANPGLSVYARNASQPCAPVSSLEMDNLSKFDSSSPISTETLITFSPENASLCCATDIEAPTAAPRLADDDARMQRARSDDGSLERIGLECEESMVTLADSFSDSPTIGKNLGSLDRKLQWNSPKDYRPTRSSPLKRIWTDDRRGATGIIVSSSPTSQPCHIFAAAPEVALDKPVARKALCDGPIAFVDPLDPPKPIKDGSPVVGLSPHGCIYTHFRLGSALNRAASLWRHGAPERSLIELYARVTQSHREGYKQFFEFTDIFFPTRPPKLQAEWIGWEGLPFLDLVGSIFLNARCDIKMCRAVGRIIREQHSKSWKMCILSVREASWDDVETVKATVFS